MKTLLLTFLLLINTNSFAESHGGVLLSNALLKAVTNYAIERGGSLERVISVKKIINKDTVENFEIAFGSQDSMTGKESIHYKLKVNATILPDDSGAIWPDGEVIIKELK